jgi:hypothetical protein
MFRKKKPAKEDVSKMVKKLRQALNGEAITADELQPYDLSQLSIEQLNALWDIRRRMEEGTLSMDEAKKELEIAFKKEEKPKPTWFCKDEPGDPWYEETSGIMKEFRRKPSWWRDNDGNEHEWHEVRTYEVPQEAITGSNLADNSDHANTLSTKEISLKTKPKSIGKRLQNLFSGNHVTVSPEDDLVTNGNQVQEETPVIEMKQTGKEMLQEKLKEFEAEFEENRVKHDKWEMMNKANENLGTYISRIL